MKQKYSEYGLPALWRYALRVLQSAFVVMLLAVSAVQAATPTPGTAISNAASATYVPAGYTQTETTYSNLVVATVAAVESLTLSQDQSIARPAGAQVTLSHLLTNTGNIASSYTLGWSNNGAGCSASTMSLGALRVARDLNANGAVDAGDPTLALNTAGVLSLAPGESATLLVQGTVPIQSSGSACLTLTATTASQGLSVTNNDYVTVTGNAVLALTKSAVYSGGFVVPGSTQIDYTINGTNIGAQDASATATALPGATSIVVDGTPASMVLIRDAIPTGTQYIAGSLKSSQSGVLRLFRLPGDAAFSYRTGGDDASAIEVAIGVLSPGVIARNASIQMRFSVTVLGTATANITNNAQSYYNDGAQSALSSSNSVLVALTPASLTVSKSAGTPLPNVDSSGNSLGTSDVTFTVKIKNSGSVWLYDVQVPDVLEGSSAFGTYTTSTTPAAGQYTLVASSLALTQPGGTVGGTVASVNSAYTGTASLPNLLAANAILPPGAEVDVQFTVRFNTSGRPASVINTVIGQAALVAGGSAIVSSSSASATISTQVPVLTVVKSASLPRYVSTGVFDIDYTIRVTNGGTVEAPYVRVIDNLDCTFDMDKSSGAISSWQLVGSVKVTNGYLAASSAYTGSATCDRTKLASTSAYQYPTETSLDLVDGARSLAANQSETITFTVRITEKSAYYGVRSTFTNKAWAVSLSRNTMDTASTVIVGASSASVSTTVIDPQGTVYNSVTREAISGATVTITRQSCTGTAGVTTTIQSSEIVGGTSSAYTYNADGSVSMTTDSNGAWQFYWVSPPVTGICTYSISVTPPSGSGYVYPSQRIPATSGTFSSCGAIVSNAGVPQSTDSTTYYLSFNSGLNTDGTACDVLHDHIPLDPGALTGLVLRKDGSKQQVEFGDFIDYALTVSNKTGYAITGLTFTDSLPQGFAYVRGSSRLNGVATSDPQGGAGPRLVWSFPSLALASSGTAVVRYRVRVGVGARVSAKATNTAVATGISTSTQSNQASYTVKVNGGVFSDEAFAFGKVYMDCKGDHIQNGDDGLGVPGVRLWLEDGTNVVTDSEGKWSLYGLRPVTHVLRLDETTLPAGATVALLDNRNAGNPHSRFLDLKNGELHKGDFPLLGCQDPDTMKEVKARRESAAKRADAEGQAVVATRLDPKQQTITTGDLRALPATGQVAGGGGAMQVAPATGALIALPSVPGGSAGSASSFVNGSVGGSSLSGTLGMAQNAPPTAGTAGSAGTAGGAAAQPASATLPAQPLGPSVIALEEILPELDNTPDFLELKDHDTVASQVLNVRVKGPADSTLRLSVNGVAIGGNRVGKKASLGKTATTAWEYIGIVLKPGENRLRLDVIDDFGVARGDAKEISVTAPDKLGIILIEVPGDARADLRTPIPVRIRLTDAAGVPVTARTQLTLEAEAGRWQEKDLNPSEPGLQAFADGGAAVFHLIPPGTPGDVRLRVSAGTQVKEVRLTLAPDLRPMIAVGIVEGTLDLSNRGRLSVGQIPAGAAFEQELSSLGKADGNNRAGGRTAFFLKGAIKGEYLLTAALDTGKSSQQRLFRDIRPDEFYPIYGDSSVRGFDAQSTQKIYVRIDKNRSYLLYGDFTTASSPEVRKLSQVSRTLTGVKDVYQTDNLRVTSYASQTAQKQQIEEFAARGISGPYYLSASGDFVDNSEKVEIVVRDRNQPNVILQSTQVARYTDYTIEPLSKRILFTYPVSSTDTSLNPQSIRVTYELNDGGDKYLVAGVDAQVKVGDALQVGVVANTDRDPQNRRELHAVTALARLGENTSVAAEVVRTDTDKNGAGAAERVELRHLDGKLGVTAQAARSSATFDNPGAGFSAGRTEGNARAEYAVGPATTARAEVLYSTGASTSGSTQGASAGVLQRFSDVFSGEFGLRHGASSSSTASIFNYGQVSSYSGVLGSSQAGTSITSLGTAANAINTVDSRVNDLTTVRARLTAAVPNLPQAQAFVEGEQDITDAQRRMVGLGANYAITDKSRIYGRYEPVSSLYTFTSSQTTRNTGILGVESNYMEGGRVYNEYRLADSLDGRAAQAALGVRNTFKLDDHWRLTGGVERTSAIGQATANSSVNGLGSSTAITTGLEYTNGRVRASGILEGRRGSDADTVLASGGMGLKFNPDWSLLARAAYSSSRGNGTQTGNERTLSRQQIGAAYRPVNQNVWNALMRYEHKTESIRGSVTTAGSISGNAFGSSSDGSLPGDYEAHIVSAHLNVNPRPGDYFAGRLAAKVSTQDDGLLKSTYAAQLLSGRWTRDLNNKWDIGVQAGLLHGSGGALQKTVGLEAGYQVIKDLWLSAGYNFIGLSDRDLTAGEYTSRGAFIRLRFKFDETVIGFPPQANSALAANGGPEARAAGESGSAQRNPVAPPASVPVEPPVAQHPAPVPVPVSVPAQAVAAQAAPAGPATAAKMASSPAMESAAKTLHSDLPPVVFDESLFESGQANLSAKGRKMLDRVLPRVVGAHTPVALVAVRQTGAVSANEKAIYALRFKAVLSYLIECGVERVWSGTRSEQSDLVNGLLVFKSRSEANEGKVLVIELLETGL